ncbi:MAG: helix-turn-helix transcriptional regulator [Oscillospiraceae bacterium]|nr:helix-turn-helix transcriptional regulator [Oscillospiraceae bacterium]
MHYYEKIKELRVKNKLAQQQIADVLEIKQQQYQRYESGQREIPLHLLIKLADFYNVSLDYLAGRSDEEPNAEKQTG